MGEIVPHNLSAELTEGNGGPQIVVQGADHEGSEFKITLAQQLLLAQHLLNQVQTQRHGRPGNGNEDGEAGTEQAQIATGKRWKGFVIRERLVISNFIALFLVPYSLDFI